MRKRSKLKTYLAAIDFQHWGDLNQQYICHQKIVHSDFFFRKHPASAGQWSGHPARQCGIRQSVCQSVYRSVVKLTSGVLVFVTESMMPGSRGTRDVQRLQHIAS